MTEEGRMDLIGLIAFISKLRWAGLILGLVLAFGARRHRVHVDLQPPGVEGGISPTSTGPLPPCAPFGRRLPARGQVPRRAAENGQDGIICQIVESQVSGPGLD